MIDAIDIKRVCAAAAHFSAKAGLRFKAMPVLVWEFGAISEFMEARANLMMAITPEMQGGRVRTKKICSEVEEIDCHGITLRLVCKEKVMHMTGPYGATDIEAA